MGEYIPTLYFPNTLRQWIDSGLIEKELALRFGIQIIYAISYARKQGVDIHQDLKPENVMITPQGVAKVTDWGLSRIVPREKETVKAFSAMPYKSRNKNYDPTGSYGSAVYASPELYDEQAIPTPQADIFSIAVILGEMLSGERFLKDTPISELKHILKGVEAETEKRFIPLLSACLSSKPENRPNSLDEIKELIGMAFKDLTGVPIEGEPPQDIQTNSDRGQRAYALGMLGKLDETLQAFKDMNLMRTGLEQKEKTGQKKSKDQAPLVMMDLKEKGFVAITPSALINDAKKKLHDEPENFEHVKSLSGMYSLSGDYKKAIELCEQYLAGHPNHLESLGELVYLHTQQENFTGALNYSEKYLKLKPVDVKIWLKQANCFEHLGRINDALQSVQKAITAEPENTEARIILGHYLSQLHRYAEAKEEFENCIEIDPQNALVCFNLASVAIETNDAETALTYLQRTIEIDPHMYQALNTLGVIYMQLSQYQDALEYFEKAIAAEPNYARPWFNKGQIYHILKKDDLAKKAFQKALEIDPSHAFARQALRDLK
jgi:tetratricopeptide (TPR) repeat protein